MNSVRLLVIKEAHGAFASTTLDQLADHLRRGDLLVVNDAATLPASLLGALLANESLTAPPVEIRLMAPDRSMAAQRLAWPVVIFGEGDWRTPTENRAPPPRLVVGDRLSFPGGLSAEVVAEDPLSPRLVRVRLDVSGEPSGNDDAVHHALYAAGRLVQYAYRQAPLSLWDHQTPFATVPVAVEPPSSGLRLTWRVLLGLQALGVEVVSLTHGTGLSSTGDPAIDAALPFPERYEIPPATALALAKARAGGRRILAVGTGVTRALESAALAAPDGVVQAGAGVARLKIGKHHQRRIVSGILTGMHEVASSHRELIDSFASRSLVDGAYASARAQGFVWHEVGDLCLIL